MKDSGPQISHHAATSKGFPLEDLSYLNPFFEIFDKIFANQPPVFIISFHLPEIPPLPLG